MLQVCEFTYLSTVADKPKALLDGTKLFLDAWLVEKEKYASLKVTCLEMYSL